MAIFSKKRFLILFFLIIALTGAFKAGFFWAEITIEPKVIFDVSNPDTDQPQEIDFSLFWRNWALLREKHVDKEKIDPQEMVYGAISGMVGSLKDPYTVFLKPDEAKRFKDDVSGSFEGVGMEIGIRKNQLTIISPLEGTPAKRAGLRAGDKILKIDETSADGISIDEAVGLIRGPKDTMVKLTIMREGWKEANEFWIIRGVIEIPSLKWELIQTKNKEIPVAHLTLYNFSEKAGNDFKKTVNEILDSPARKIILDLRNNPGGYLEVSQDIASWFLEKGQIVAIEDFGPGQEEKLYKSRGNGKLLRYPLVVLINQGSASASEILAGCLQDNRGVKLIGEKSYGKGSVQELEDLTGGATLKITVARWLTPNRRLISEVGLEPDVKVEMMDEDIEKGLDPQLDKALEIIENL